MTLTLLEFAALAAIALYALSVLLKPPFRADLRAHPALTFALAVGGGLALAGSTYAFARWPMTLHAAAILGLLGVAAAWWRARPTYGRPRNWPPGSLSLAASLDAVGNRAFYAEQFETHGPVFKMAQFHRPVLCVYGLGRGRRLLRDHGWALAGASLPYNRFVPKGSLRYMTAEDHEGESPLFREAIARLPLEGWEHSSRFACRRILDEAARARDGSPEEIDPRTVIDRWVLDSLAGVFFGIPSGHPDIEELGRISRALDLDSSGGPLWRRRMERAFVEATGLMAEWAQRQRSEVDSVERAGGGSVLDRLVGQDPDALETDVRARNLALIFRLAIGDLASLLSWVLTMLSADPTWPAEVRKRPSGAGAVEPPADIATRVVFETLRLEQSEYLYRTVAHPFEFEGYSIPAGWLVRVCVQESHRDPEIFENPTVFDPGRFVGRMPSRRQYSPFGADEHGCMGVSMVHFFGRIFVEELCDGFDWRVVRDGPLDRGTRHRHHWKPSATRRIVLEKRPVEASA